MPALGRQLAVDLFDCASETDLNHVEFVREAMLTAAKAGNATIVDECFHHFSPHGVSGVVVIAESHIAVHTWPEHRYLAVDIFTCGTGCSPEKMQESLIESFQPGRTTMEETERGVMSIPVEDHYPPEQPN